MHPQASPRKRRAAPHAPPADAVVKMENEEAGSGDPAAPKRVRAVPPQHHHQDIFGNVIVEPPPLGLQLRKSKSFMDLIQTIISKPTSDCTMDNIISEPPIKRDIKSGSITAGERPKASNFPANFLKIGNWEYTSHYEGDLVAKCYYAKHKLVWEVLDAGLKSKIEVQWSHIIALKATCPEDGDGTLDLVLCQPPIFFQENDPQPRKHTLWQPSSDFTGGQASMHRRHILRCSSGVLSRNFEKIIRYNQRLYQLSQEPAIILDSPVFNVRSSLFENPNESDGSSPKFTHLASPSVVSPVFENDGVKHIMLKQPECFSRPVNLDIQENYVAHVQNNTNLYNQPVPELRSSMSMDDLLSHINNCITSAGNPQMPNVEVSSKELLEIAESLLSDTHGPPSIDEKYLMARVDSLCCLLEKDTTPSIDDTDEKLGSPHAQRIMDVTESSINSRNSSFADLLQNLPRIASVSQLLFDIAEDQENSGSNSQK